MDGVDCCIVETPFASSPSAEDPPFKVSSSSFRLIKMGLYDGEAGADLILSRTGAVYTGSVKPLVFLTTIMQIEQPKRNSHCILRLDDRNDRILGVDEENEWKQSPRYKGLGRDRSGRGASAA